MQLNLFLSTRLLTNLAIYWYPSAVHIWTSYLTGIQTSRLRRGFIRKSTGFKINMAKNKQRGKKQQNVFQVANKQSKPKTKAKPVKTSLKHVSSCLFTLLMCLSLGLDSFEIFALNMLTFSPQINTVRNEKVESLNQMFTEVQQDVRNISKPTTNETKKGQKVKHFLQL